MTRTELGAGPAAGTGAQAFGALGVAALFVALGGVYWDVSWHVTIGRESFWIPPHLLVYSGTAVFFASVVGAFLLSASREGSPRATGRAGAGFFVGALGASIQVCAAPLDDLWHRLYGLDVTVWSPPHLMGMAGALLGIYGLTCALGTGLRGEARRTLLTLPGANVLFLFAAALALSMFALGPLDFRLGMRDALFYPLLAGPLAAIPLVAAARYTGRFGAATAAALIYTVFRVLALLIFVGMGAFDDPGPPIFLPATALAVDLVFLGKKEDGQHGVLGAAILFGPVFVLSEWAFRASLGANNWEPLEVTASLAVVTLACASGVLAGDRLGYLLRSG